MASNSYTFYANCTYDREYVKAGQTVVGGPTFAVLPPWVHDDNAGVFGAALPVITAPSGGGGPLLGSRAIHLS
jgi:hypothetical protein